MASNNNWHDDEKPSYHEVFYPEPGQFPPLHKYTRETALAHGALIDVTPHAELEGFRYPVALSHGAYIDAVAEYCRWKCCPEIERLHQVLFELGQAIAHSPKRESTRTYVCISTRDGEGCAYLLDLISECAPGPDGKKVITIMRPEDV